MAEAAEYLKGVAASEQLGGIPVERHTIIGAGAPTLIDAVHFLSVDFVVACRHGVTGFTQWGLGSVAHKLVQHCPVPLLILPDERRTFAALEQPQIRVLLPLDGSSFSGAVLEPVAHFLAGFTHTTSQGGTVLLLLVVGIPASYGRFRGQFATSDSARLQAEVRRQGEQYLATVAKRLMTGDLARYRLAVTTRVATDPDVAKAITHTAEQELVDMIAMTTHGWGGVLHWAIGSIMERVLHTSRVPLFILRPETG